MTQRNALQVSPELQDGLDFLANHDIKAASYPVLVSEGPFTTTGLARAVSQNVGLKLDCVVTYPDTYHLGGFARIDEGSPHRGQPTRLFTAIREDIGLPTVGAMLSWSEKYNFPIMTALSTTAGKGSKAPFNTIQLLEGMLSGANVGEIEHSRYKKAKDGVNTQHNGRLKNLVDLGLVVFDEPEPSFEILDTEYKGITPFDSLSQTQQNVYRILKIAQAVDSEANKKWTIDSLMKLAGKTALIDQHNPTQFYDFKHRLTRVISAANPRYSPGATETVELAGRRYAIADHFQAAAEDLVERVIHIDRSPSKRHEYTEVAKEIYLDVGMLGRIIKRGVETSPFINANR